MKQKINLRLQIIAVIGVLATAICLTMINYNLFQKQVRNDLEVCAQVLKDTDLFQSIYEDAVENDFKVINHSALRKLEADNLRITWIREDGWVLYDNDINASELSNHLDRPEIKEAIEKGEGSSVRKSDTFNLNTFYYALKLENDTILRVSMQASSMLSIFLTSLPIVGLLILIILVICIVIGHLLTMNLMEPLDKIAENLDDNLNNPVYAELEPYVAKIRAQHENILEAAASRQDFTASISHELKTPLTAISGYAELIENHMIGPEQEEHIAQQIRQNADRLLSLINDTIKLSELDYSEMERSFEPIDLYEVARECCEELQVNAKQKNVRLSFSGNSCEINADRELIKELIENLVQNAIRYNKENGYVWVSVDRINHHALLVVRDNGIGIPKDKQEHVFERFYRVDKSRSRQTGGTGLGLAIVKHIAEIHNATITLNSDLGVGTKIIIAF